MMGNAKDGRQKTTLRASGAEGAPLSVPRHVGVPSALCGCRPTCSPLEPTLSAPLQRRPGFRLSEGTDLTFSGGVRTEAARQARELQRPFYKLGTFLWNPARETQSPEG